MSTPRYHVMRLARNGGWKVMRPDSDSPPYAFDRDTAQLVVDGLIRTSGKQADFKIQQIAHWTIASAITELENHAYEHVTSPAYLKMTDDPAWIWLKEELTNLGLLP